MKVAIPIQENNGLESNLFDHFGKAKKFLIVDSDSQNYEVTENQKLSGIKTKCKSHQFSDDIMIDAVITKCIGDGSLRKLNHENIKVFKAEDGNIKNNIELLKSGDLNLFHMFDICRDNKNKKEHKGCHTIDGE